jgi:hypothetical protein
MPPYTDHMGLVVTTSSADAAASYAEGVQLLLSESPNAVPVLGAAVAADPSFAMVYAALALATADQTEANEEVADALERNLVGCTRATRRERQHMEIIALAVRGDRERAHALGRGHLHEFPDDMLIAHVVARSDRAR